MNKLIRYLLVAMIIIGLGTLAFAQSTKGVVAGVITDSTGAVVTKANVTVTSDETGETHTIATGPNGEYRVEALIPGSYTVVVEGAGFSKTEVKGVVVRTSQVTPVNVALSVAQKSETVEVVAGVDTIQTESGDLSKTINPTEVKDLPLISGNPFALATTLPGVSTVAGRDDMTNGAGFSVNGLRPRSNNFLIDGFDNNDNGIAGQAFQPANPEAVQEVTVLTNSYSAEYGRGGASVSNLSFKSGTNDYHGAAWYNYDGSKLDTLSSQQKLSDNTLARPPQYVQNVFGFRMGGPVVKQKLFFFGTAQWNRNFGASSYASTLSLPTASGVTALQALNNSNADMILSAIGNLRGNPAQNQISSVNIGPRANCPAASVDASGNCEVEFGNFTRTDHTASKSYEWTARADYIASQNDTIYARFTNSYGSFSPDLFANSGALPSQDTYQGGPSRLFGAMWAHTFSPTVVNEFRFSAQQIDFNFAPLAATLANPDANLPTVFLSSSTNMFWGGYSQGSFPQERGHNTFQIQDAVGFIRGTHAMKAGVDIGIFLMHDMIPFNANGTITVSDGGDCPTITGGCTDLANWLDNYLGPTGSIGKNFGNPRLNIPTSQQAYYFQDSWKVRPNLTVNYGVRYEYQPPDGENILQYPGLNMADWYNQGLLTRVAVKSDRNNFGPRFGFAYTPKWGKRIFGEDKTVIRGGYGIFYDTFFTNIADNSASTSPNTLGGSVVGGTDPAGTGRGELNPMGYVSSISAAFSPTATVYSTVNNLKNPQIHQWNFGFQREFPAGFLLESAYVGTRGEGMFVTQQLNPGDVNTGLRIHPQYGSVNVRSNGGDSIYHGWQTSVSHSLKNLTLRGSYTWSRSIDNQSEIFATSGYDARWMISFDPRSDRGPSAFNRTHRFSLAYVYDLPALKNHGFLTAVAGGWSTSGTLSYQSGAPQTIGIIGYDQNGDKILNDRPSWGNPAAAINYSHSCLIDPACITGVGYDDGSGQLIDFNTGAAGTLSQFHYIVSGTGANGNVTRNSYVWPGTFSENMTVRKQFHMPYREGHNLEVRADFFNVWNHKNAGVTNLIDGGDINSAHFMDLSRTIDGNRNIVLWLKYSF